MVENMDESFLITLSWEKIQERIKERIVSCSTYREGVYL